MPGFDGTGPDSKGPMTGRGQGDCIVPASVDIQPDVDSAATGRPRRNRRRIRGSQK